MIDDEIMMKPQVGDSSVYIPMTLDVPKNSGWARYKSRIIIGSTAFLFLNILCLALLFYGFGLHILIRIPLALVLGYVGFMAIRVFVLEEKVFRKDYEYLYNRRRDLRFPATDLWGIFSVEGTSPHIAHFANGRIGLFVLFEKNVRVGHNTPSQRFKHYEAIANAYRAVGRTKAELTHIDFMSSYGDSERLENLYSNLETTDNLDLKGLLNSMYDNLKDYSASTTSTYDVYLLTVGDSPERLWQVFHEFQLYMLEANYLSYKIMDQDDIRNLTITLFNLGTEFSANATSRRLVGSGESMVTPVRIIHVGGIETLFDSDGTPRRSVSLL